MVLQLSCLQMMPKIYFRICRSEDGVLLQQALDLIAVWASEWQISISVLNIGHSRCEQQVALLWQRDHATRLSVEILQLQNILFEN